MLLTQIFVLCMTRDATGKFPEYPEEEEGGSAAIFTPKDPAEVYYLSLHSSIFYLISKNHIFDYAK